MMSAHTAPPDATGALLRQMALAAQGVGSGAAFEAWCRGPLRAYLPFGSLFCAAGQVRAGLVVVQALFVLDWRRIDLARLRRPIPVSERRLLCDWLLSRRPQIVADEATAQQRLSPLEWSEYSHHALRNIAAHGVMSADGGQATYVSFSHMPAPLPDDLNLRLELAVPLLHQAIARVPALVRLHAATQGPRSAALSSQPGPDRASLGSPSGGPGTPAALSAREWALAGGLVRGLTNAALAAELQRSPSTVKHQLTVLMQKLGTANRAETVARILAIGQSQAPGSGELQMPPTPPGTA